MMKCYGFNGSFKYLIINFGRGRKVYFLVCLFFRLNFWDYWKLSKYDLIALGYICFLCIFQFGFGLGLNIIFLVINDDLIIKYNEDFML